MLKEGDGGFEGASAPKKASAKARWVMFEAVAEYGPSSLAALTEKISQNPDLEQRLTDRTVRSARNELEQEGWIEWVDLDTPPGGPTEKMWRLGPASWVLSFAVGREELRCALVDGHGTRRAETSATLLVLPLRHSRQHAPLSPDGLVKALIRLGRAVLAEGEKKAGVWRAPQTVALAWPGQIDEQAHGPVRYERNDNGWGADVLLESLVGEVLVALDLSDAQIVLANDADCEFLAESRWGVGVGAHSLLGIKLAGGVGCSLIVDGRVHRGRSRTVGELGHLRVHLEGDVLEAPAPDGVVSLDDVDYCSCPEDHPPHLERWASGRAMIERLVPDPAELADGYEPVLAMIEEESPAALYVLGQTAELVAEALAGPILLLEPDVVVVSSAFGCSRLAGLIAAALILELHKPVDVRPARIEAGGNWNPVIGAAAHAIERCGYPGSPQRSRALRRASMRQAPRDDALGQAVDKLR